MKKIPNCERCKDRETCQTPCPALRASLKKVTNMGREWNVGVPSYVKDEWPSPANAGKKLSKLQFKARRRDYILLTLLGLGFDRSTVEEVLGITHEKMRFILFRAKKRLRVKQQK